jgi:hypothetical protein
VTSKTGPLPNPKDKPLHGVREVRDKVARRVETLIESLDR